MKLANVIRYILVVTILVVLAWSGNELQADTATVEVSSVNVRSGPGTDNSIIEGLSSGTRVEIIEERGDWWKVRFNGQQGWVKSEYLKKEITLTVSGSIVNLRSGPGTNYDIVRELRQGEKLIRLDTSGEWYKVLDSKNNEGYVANTLVTTMNSSNSTESVITITNMPVPTSNGSDPEFGYIRSSEVVNVRNGPGTSYDIIGQLKPDTNYALLGEAEEWCRIRFDGDQNAYVAGYVVQKTIIPPTNATATPESPTNTTVTPELATDIRVQLNGQTMSFEVPPIIENGRTLVPLRAIFEALGATVEWNGDTRTVTATQGNMVIILPIGSLTPTVNGVDYPLDVAATIVNGRTLAPLRFVGETLGATVDWDGDTRTVFISTNTAGGLPAEVIVREDSTSIRNGPGGEYEKLGALNAGQSLKVLAQRDGWYQVSYEGQIVWVASWLVDAIYPTEGETSTSPTGSGPPPMAPGALTTTQGLNNRGDENAVVKSGYLSLSTILDDSGYRLVMKGAEALDPQIQESNQGRKIVYIFSGVKIEGERDELSFYIGGGRNARVAISAQTIGDNTWVTVEMPLSYKYVTTHEASDTKVVFTIVPQIMQIQNINLNNGNQILVIKGSSKMNYQERLDGSTLNLNLAGTLPGFADALYTYSNRNDLAETLAVTESNGSTRLALQFGSEVEEYIITQNSEGNQISIALIKDSGMQPPDVTQPDSRIKVMLDPGHGGSEPGSISNYSGIEEKDINLPIALQAKQLLEAAGIEVLMIREDDSYVALNDRGALANQAGVDLYVSIHANSFTDAAANGTETYYYAPEDNSALYTQEYERSLLAQLLQEAMVKYCDRRDRGVKQNNYAVLRETTMPSALVEIAFLSNEEEERLLQSPEFQKLVAQAIAEGIERYVKIML